MSIWRGVIVPRADGPTPSTSAPPGNSSPQSSLPSAGVIAGIAVAGAVAIFGTMGFIYFVVSRHRRRRLECAQSNARDFEEEVKIQRPPRSPPHELGQGHSSLTIEAASDVSLIHVSERKPSSSSTKKPGNDGEKNAEGGYLRQGYMSMSLEDALPAYSIPLSMSIPVNQAQSSTQPCLETTSKLTKPGLEPTQDPPLLSPHSPHSPLPNPHNLPNSHEEASVYNHTTGDLSIDPTDTVTVSPSANASWISDPPAESGAPIPHVDKTGSINTIHPSEYQNTQIDAS